jgi:hypothetical protein
MYKKRVYETIEEGKPHKFKGKTHKTKFNI